VISITATASIFRRNLTAEGYREGRQIHSRLPAIDTGVVLASKSLTLNEIFAAK